MKRVLVWIGVWSMIGVTGVSAATFNSSNFSINGTLGDSIAGRQTSTNYQMTSAGGESIAGTAASSSYRLGLGYVSTLEESIQLTMSPSTVTIPAITPGTSTTANVTASVYTDAPGYNLAVSQNNNLQNGGNSIPAVSGSIASPVSWVEGTTKGLGFTLVSTNATAIPGKWGSGGSYAAMPGSSTTFYTRTGYNGGANDTLNMRYRLDTTTAQVSGSYSNIATWTGTTTP